MPRPKQTPWRQDPVILARLPEVERRVLAGEPNTGIAAALRVDEITIRRDRHRLAQLWRERAAGKIEDLKAEAVARLQHIYRLALADREFDREAESAVLYGEAPSDAPGQAPASPAYRYVQRDEKGSAQFRGNKAGSLTVARQAVMDMAKVQGLLVDKIAETDSKGQDLPLAALQERYARAHERTRTTE